MEKHVSRKLVGKKNGNALFMGKTNIFPNFPMKNGGNSWGKNDFPTKSKKKKYLDEMIEVMNGGSLDGISF